MRKIVIAAFVMAMMISCGEAPEIKIEEGSKMGYALNFFRSVSRSLPEDENVFVSPYSAGMALSMLAEGAQGETKIQLLRALNGIPFKEQNLYTDSSIVVASANSIWLRDGFSIKDSYKEQVKEDYSALVSELDFSDPSAVGVINGWCSDNTAGRIPEIVKEIDPSIVMYLMNALYFKAPWDLFDKKATRPGTFYGSRGESEVEFMNATKDLCYFEYMGCQVVRIPYADGQYNLLVALPPQNITVPMVLDYIQEGLYNMVESKLETRRVALTLPKFKLETTVNLNDALRMMRVTDAFGDADFSAMTRASVAVSEVVQKCFVEVSEEGTEAAAVTNIGVKLTAVRPMQEAVQMKVDRPFIMVIKETQTDNVLFAGKIMNL